MYHELMYNKVHVTFVISFIYVDSEDETCQKVIYSYECVCKSL